MSKWKTGLAKGILGTAMLGLASVSVPSLAHAVIIPMVADGTVGGTLVFKGDLTGLGITDVTSITVTDDGTPVGGASGIFSGFDLDALFLDVDGLLTTTGDRFFASSFAFTAGTTRPTANPIWLPNATHPGPTFGSLDATTIDLATATLNVLDAVSSANVSVADGFLTLGDGGTLVADFAPPVAVGATLFLLVGEVGGQVGEGLGASVAVSVPVPEPATVTLFGIGLLGLGFLMRRRGLAA